MWNVYVRGGEVHKCRGVIAGCACILWNWYWERKIPVRVRIDIACLKRMCLGSAALSFSQNCAFVPSPLAPTHHGPGARATATLQGRAGWWCQAHKRARTEQEGVGRNKLYSTVFRRGATGCLATGRKESQLLSSKRSDQPRATEDLGLCWPAQPALPERAAALRSLPPYTVPRG